MKAEMESSPNFPFFLLAVPGYDLSFVLHVTQSDTGIQRTLAMQYIAHRLGNKRPLQEGRGSDQRTKARPIVAGWSLRKQLIPGDLSIPHNDQPIASRPRVVEKMA